MANEPKINLALVGEMPENPVRGTVYMSPDASGNFVKVGVDGSVRTIFDGSDYVRKDESVWIPGYGEKSAVLANDYSYAAGDESVSHGSMTYARGTNSHAEGVGSADYSISVYSNFSNNIIYSTNTPLFSTPESYIGFPVSYEGVCATIIDASLMKGRILFVLDKPLLDDGSDFMESTEVYLLSSGVAAGRHSHTEGYSTVAVGDRAHTEGCATYAGSLNSHAEGVETATYGEGAHAEGSGTLATGPGSHVEGNATAASGNYSHAEGIGTRASGECSHAEGEGREFSITINGSAGVTHYTVSRGSLADIKEGDIIRYHELEKKLNILLPYEKRNPDNGFRYAIIREVHLGKNRYIEVDNTLDPRDAIINGTAYILRGVAEGTGSHSEGYYTNTIGNYSHSEGAGTRALGDYSHVEGDSATASGASSHAEGSITTAFGNYSHAEGYGATALGTYSHAEGSITTASGNYSHAEGYDATASGNSSHAEGQSTTASGESSHAEGHTTTAKGHFSHAEGESTIAEIDAVAAHVEGYHTIAKNRSEHAEGEFNISHVVDNGENYTLYSIGNGTDASNRRNILEVLFDGSVYIRDIGGYDGSNYMDASTLQEVINAAGSGDVADLMTNVTYTDLKNLRDTSALIPGMQYRITDYECTTAQTDTSVAGHVFDIIVTADSETELNENARAAHHEGDTYFQTCDLDAWELKYCLDNDTDMFAWADDTNGKGIVYYMKDEWCNECPYDFKNILFKRWEVTECVKCPSLVINNSENPFGLYYGAKNFSGENVISDASYGSNSDWFYTFALKDISGGQWYDYSILNYLKLKNSESLTMSCQMNKISYNIEIDAGNIKQYLNNIVFFNCVTNLLDEAHPVSSDCTRNIFSNACHSSTFGINCYDNIFGNQNYGNTAGMDFASNKAEAYCTNNVFGNNIQCNSFDIYFAFNSIKDNAVGNSFGKYCYNNIIGLSFETNTLGMYCYNNTFGDSTYSNTFGNEYCDNTAGMHMVFNFFQNRCNNNTFGVYFESNTVGNGCAYSSFGNYLLSCTFFNYITYCNITGGTSTSAPVRYSQILDGTKGADQNNRLTISLAVNKNYQQTAGLNSSGVLKIWTPADLID